MPTVLKTEAIEKSTYNRRRTVTIEGTYDSTFGEDLPIKDQCEFRITNLEIIPHD